MAVDDSQLILRGIADVSDEDLQNFDCGVENLNHFLTQESRVYSEHGLTETSVAFWQDDVSSPIAYFALSADSIRLNITERGELGLPFDADLTFFPAVKITKLAVHKDMQSKGIGRMLIDLISGMVFSTNTAVRLLNVNSLNNERTLAFYSRMGFIVNLDAQEKKDKKPPKKKNRAGTPNPDQTVLMHLDIYQD